MTVPIDIPVNSAISVRETLQVTQCEDLTALRGQRRNRVLEQRFVFPVDQPAFRRTGVLFGQLHTIQVIQILGQDNSRGPISIEPVNKRCDVRWSAARIAHFHRRN